MRDQELASDYARLNNRIKAVHTSSGSEDIDETIISLSMSFICVDICGRLEQNLKSIFSEFASRKSNRCLDKSIAKLVSHYQNPNPNKILELVSLFDSELADWLADHWKEDATFGVAKKRIENLVDDRITLAHSKKTSHNVSMDKLRNYFSEYKELSAFLAKHFLDIQVYQANKYTSLRSDMGLPLTYTRP